MNQARRRCPQCLYLRHPNDDRKTPPDICPNCGRLYDKSRQQVERERRARSFRAHRMLELRYCGACREAVSLYAAQCPHCHEPLKGAYSLRAASVALALLLPLGFIVQSRLAEAPFSRLEGISNERYARCLALSQSYEDIAAREGATAVEAMTRMNHWHAECSRKALRHSVSASPAEVPATPAAWLLLEAAPRALKDTPKPEPVAKP